MDDALRILGNVAAAAAVVLAAWITTRQARQSQRDQSKVEQRRNHNDALIDTVRVLRTEVNELRDDRREDRDRIDTLEREVRGLRRGLNQAQEVLQAAVAYAERLLALIADRIPGTPVPPPPPELHGHLSDAVLEDWRTPPTTGEGRR